MRIRNRFKFLAVAITFAVVLAGCEELLGGLLDFGLQDYIDELEDGELTVNVTGADDFTRADVWVEPIDVDEIVLALEDLGDDDAVEAAVQDWLDEQEPRESFPDDIYAGYGSDQFDSTVSDRVTTDATINGTITTGENIILEGNIYVVYVVLTDEDDTAPEAKIGVTFAIVDGNSSVGIAYDDEEFDGFPIDE